MTVNLNRRGLLSSVAVAGSTLLAGCLDIFDPNPDIAVFNRSDSIQTANVVLVDASEAELLSEQASIEPDEAFEADDVFPSSGTVTLSISVDGGPSGQREFDISEDTAIYAYINDDISFDEF